MQKYTFFFLLLLVPIVYAVPVLNITPNPITVNALQNTVQIFDFNVSNQGNETLYNLSFTAINGFSFPKDIEITPNESKIISFNVSGVTTIPSLISTNVSFYYNEIAYLGGLNYVITEGTTGFSETTKTVYKSDSITFRNSDIINHTVTQYSPNGFNKELQPSEETIITFNSIGTFYYKDMITGLTTAITVINNEVQQKAHDPTLDQIVLINYNFVFDKADLNVESISPSNFSLSYSTSQEGAIVLNTNTTTYNVKLGSSLGWTTFDSYDFKMNENATKVIKFIIKPNIEKKTNNTGMTYYETIQITSSNSDPINVSVPVYIESYDFGSFTINGTVCPPVYTYTIQGVDNVLSFCNANPDYGQCPQLFVLTKEVSRQNEANFSQADFEAWVANNVKNDDYFRSIDNTQSNILSSVQTAISSFAGQLTNYCEVEQANQTQKIWQLEGQVADLNDKLDTSRALLYGFVIFLVIIVGCVGAFIAWKKKEAIRKRITGVW